MIAISPETLTEKVRRSEFLRFVCVGSFGFVIDAVSFTLLHWGLNLELMQARGMAFVIAATAVWWGNRSFTFQQVLSDHGAVLTQTIKQWLKAMCGASLGAIPNLLMFHLVNDFLQQIPVSSLLPSQWSTLLAFVIGVGCGLVANYLLNKYWVFAVKANCA